jgi:hypothetical protein
MEIALPFTLLPPKVGVVAILVKTVVLAVGEAASQLMA